METRVRHVLRTGALVGDGGDDVIISRATLAHALQSPALGTIRTPSSFATWAVAAAGPYFASVVVVTYVVCMFFGELCRRRHRS